MTSVVLDASALLALLRDEPGAGVVAAAMAGALISTVNYSEVLKKVIERGGTAVPIAAFVRRSAIAIIAFDEAQAELSANIYPQTKAQGMSFGDRACLALALTRRLPLLTAERKMAEVDLPIKVKVIRHGH